MKLLIADTHAKLQSIILSFGCVTGKIGNTDDITSLIGIVSIMDSEVQRFYIRVLDKSGESHFSINDERKYERRLPCSVP